MAKEPKKKIKPRTAAELIAYLQQFPPESGINIGIFQRRGGATFRHDVKEMTLISDTPNACIFLTVDKAKKVGKLNLQYEREEKHV